MLLITPAGKPSESYMTSLYFSFLMWNFRMMTVVHIAHMVVMRLYIYITFIK